MHVAFPTDHCPPVLSPDTSLPRASTTSTLPSLHKTPTHHICPSPNIPLVSSNISSPTSRLCYQHLFQKDAHRHSVSSADPPARAPDVVLRTRSRARGLLCRLPVVMFAKGVFLRARSGGVMLHPAKVSRVDHWEALESCKHGRAAWLCSHSGLGWALLGTEAGV